MTDQTVYCLNSTHTHIHTHTQRGRCVSLDGVPVTTSRSASMSPRSHAARITQDD